MHLQACTPTRARAFLFLMLSTAEEAVVLGAEKDNMQNKGMQFYVLTSTDRAPEGLQTNNLETSFPSAPLTPLWKFKS